MDFAEEWVDYPFLSEIFHQFFASLTLTLSLRIQCQQDLSDLCLEESTFARLANTGRISAHRDGTKMHPKHSTFFIIVI